MKWFSENEKRERERDESIRQFFFNSILIKYQPLFISTCPLFTVNITTLVMKRIK